MIKTTKEPKKLFNISHLRRYTDRTTANQILTTLSKNNDSQAIYISITYKVFNVKANRIVDAIINAKHFDVDESIKFLQSKIDKTKTDEGYAKYQKYNKRFEGWIVMIKDIGILLSKSSVKT